MLEFLTCLIACSLPIQRPCRLPVAEAELMDHNVEEKENGDRHRPPLQLSVLAAIRDLIEGQYNILYAIRKATTSSLEVFGAGE